MQGHKIPSASLFILLISLVLTGCGEKMDQIAGDYPGRAVVTKSSEQSGQKTRSTRTRDIIARAAPIDQQSFRVDIIEKSSNKVVYEFVIMADGRDHILLKSDIFVNKDGLQLKRTGLCAERTSSNIFVSACLSDSSVKLVVDGKSDIGLYQLSIYASKNFQPQELAVKNTFTYDDLIQSVKSFTYETSLRRELVYQAKEEVRLARDRLLPKLAVGRLLEGVQSLYSIPDVLQYLVPFALPSRWFELDRQKLLFRSEELAYQALVAEQITAATEIYFAISRDELSLKELESFSGRLAAAHKRSQDLVNMGFEDPNEAAILYNRLLKAKEDLVVLKESVRQEYASLSRFLGRPVQEPLSIVPPQFPSTPSNEVTDIREILHSAQTRSLELKQLDFLIGAADKNIQAKPYSFLDPGAPGGWEIGFDKLRPLAIVSSQKRELVSRKGQAERRLEEEVSRFESHRSRIKEQAPLVSESVINSERIVKRELDHLATGENFEAAHFVDRVEELVRSKLAQIQVSLLSLQLQRKKERLLLEGPYRNLHELVPVTQ